MTEFYYNFFDNDDMIKPVPGQKLHDPHGKVVGTVELNNTIRPINPQYTLPVAPFPEPFPQPPPLPDPVPLKDCRIVGQMIVSPAGVTMGMIGSGGLIELPPVLDHG